MEKYYQVVINEMDEDGNKIKEVDRSSISQKIILLTESDSCILNTSILDMVGIFAAADSEITTAAAAGTLLRGELDRKVKKKKDGLEDLIKRLIKEDD